MNNFRMKRYWFLASALFVFLIVNTSFRASSPADLDADILTYTNQFRKAKGLPALTLQNDLSEIATRHSRNMADGRTRFGHDGFAKRSKEAAKYLSMLRAFAENVAFGPMTGKEVVEGWKNSPGHRKNMLGNFKYIGIGTATRKDGTIYFTQIFAN
jgi:uncharacterized protein YkwD